MSWEDAWREGRTRWDAGDSPPVLKRLVDEGALPRGRALVPGCGTGYDLLTLAPVMDEVVGVDLAPTAKRAFDDFLVDRKLDRDRVQYLVEDFFAFSPGSPFDVMWDYTFLCAIDPEWRGRWAERVDTLLAPDGELITLIFPVVDTPMNPGGPPHPMSPDLVRGLLEPRWEATHLEPVTTSHPARTGKEWLGRWRRRGTG